MSEETKKCLILCVTVGIVILSVVVGITVYEIMELIYTNPQ